VVSLPYNFLVANSRAVSILTHDEEDSSHSLLNAAFISSREPVAGRIPTTAPVEEHLNIEDKTRASPAKISHFAVRLPKINNSVMS
jgi:hypothetical protein